jgi:hypothetical protein
MARSEELRARIEAFAEQLREEFGATPAGEHGCLLEAVEDWAVEVGDGVARSLMQKQVSQESAATDESLCPQCQHSGRWKGQRKRRVETRRGAIHVTEPEYYCPGCRRSFFPADPSVGDGAGQSA